MNYYIFALVVLLASLTYLYLLNRKDDNSDE
jgi:hypothetical protein